jgi:hypothetical protein
MTSSASFNAVVDWYVPLPADALAEQAAAISAAVAEQALDILTPRYAIAGHDPAVAGFLTSPQARALIERLLAATIAADHFAARIPCPDARMRRLRSNPWRAYMEQRGAAVVPLAAKALANWAIWQCIAVEWFPREHVFAGVRERMRESGFDVLEITGDLHWPFPGGVPGLKTACAADRGELLARTTQGPVAAVLYQGDEPKVAVIEAPTAADILSLPGIALGPVLAAPPPSLGFRLLRAVGAGNLWWRTTRWWRGRR